MKPKITIIIEWENVLLSEIDRSFAMLKELKKQASEDINQPLEVVIVYNPLLVSGSEVENAATQHLLSVSGLEKHFSYRMEPSPNLHYYDVKNFGAQRASGEIVVFLDSDVIPQPGWLKEISQPFFDRPDIQVLAGHTYIDPVDLLGRAFSLGWFFPLPGKHLKGLSISSGFFANNVAFRRSVITQYPFPKMQPGITRGSCVQLARILIDNNITIWKNQSAVTCHPPPNGLNHFFVRALAEGRDWAANQETMKPNRIPIFIAATKKILSSSISMIRNTLKHSKSINMPLWQIPPAISIMMTFYLTVYFGVIIYFFAPIYSRKKIRI